MVQCYKVAMNAQSQDSTRPDMTLDVARIYNNNKQTEEQVVGLPHELMETPLVALVVPLWNNRRLTSDWTICLYVHNRSYILRCMIYKRTL